MSLHLEDLYHYYHAFEDSLTEEGRDEHPIIKCIVCCLKAPAYSQQAKVCEMCFDTDFWEHVLDE